MGEKKILFDSYSELEEQIAGSQEIKARFVVLRKFDGHKSSDIASIFVDAPHAEDNYHLLVQAAGKDYELSFPVLSADVYRRHIPDAPLKIEDGRFVQDTFGPGMRSKNPYFDSVLSAVITAHLVCLESIAKVSSIEIHGETIELLGNRCSDAYEFLSATDWRPSTEETNHIITVPHFEVQDYKQGQA